MNEEIQDDINPSNTVILNITESDMIRLDTICRICANQSERIIGIYNEEGLAHELAVKMNLYLPVKVSEDDTLPLHCCWSCASTVLAWHELIINSVEADRRLRELQIIASKQIIETVNEEAKVEVPAEFVKNLKEDAGYNRDSEYIIIDHCYSESPINEYTSHETLDNENNLNESVERIKVDCKNRRRKADIVYFIFCDVCNKGYTRQSDMERHRKVKHSKDFNTEEIKIEVKENPHQVPEVIDYVCRYCNERFDRNIDLKIHAKSQHGITKIRRKYNEITAAYFCDICTKGFTRKYDMKKHRQAKHPNEETCDSEKTAQSEYLSQFKIVGPDNRNYYKCGVCKKMFKYSYNLLRHQVTHTKSYTHVCHICAKQISSSSGLRRHLTEHHYGVKKFSCEICGQKFAASATREEHMNIHTNNRPFVCDICGKAFKQKASLRSHKLFHTNVYNFNCNFCAKKFRRAYELKTHTWTHTGHRPHQCHLCSSTFRLGQDLKRHLKVHDKLNECACDECGAIFSQQKYLNNHKRSHKTHTKVKGATKSVNDVTK